jgi:hypothetical protein
MASTAISHSVLMVEEEHRFPSRVKTCCLGFCSSWQCRVVASLSLASGSIVHLFGLSIKCHFKGTSGICTVLE